MSVPNYHVFFLRCLCFFCFFSPFESVPTIQLSLDLVGSRRKREEEGVSRLLLSGGSCRPAQYVQDCVDCSGEGKTSLAFTTQVT